MRWWRVNSLLIEGLITKAVRWWQTLKPPYQKLLLGLGWAIVLIGVVFMVVEIPHRQAAPLKAKIQRERDSLQPHDRLKLEHDARTALIQGLGGAALLIGLLFTWRSLRATERNLQITQDTSAKNLAIAQEGQITERFTRAIEQLGSKQREVRLGGIYALERIARDSEQDHWPIMEILTAYVREQAPIREASPNETALSRLERPLPTPTTDIQAILTVLGRRTRTYGKGEEQSLHLAETDLRGVDLTYAHLENAFFRLSRLDSAYLMEAHLEGVSFHRAHLERATLWQARLEGTDLAYAHLEHADFTDAHLEGAVFTHAFLTETNFRGAYLNGAIDLTIEQLVCVQTLYKAQLNPPLLEFLQQQCPHLLEEPQY
jgi:hypothetical protein